MSTEYIIEIESFDSEKDAIAFAENIVLKGHKNRMEGKHADYCAAERCPGHER